MRGYHTLSPWFGGLHPFSAGEGLEVGIPIVHGGSWSGLLCPLSPLPLWTCGDIVGVATPLYLSVRVLICLLQSVVRVCQQTGSPIYEIVRFCPMGQVLCFDCDSVTCGVFQRQCCEYGSVM